MADVGYLLSGLLVLGFAVQRLLGKVERPYRKLWIWKCRRCDLPLTQKPVPNVMPDAVIRYLDKHELTTPVVSVYDCPRRCYRLWYIPRFGQIEKAFFLREEM
jgi:hypothetical protein